MESESPYVGAGGDYLPQRKKKEEAKRNKKQK